MGNDKQNTSNGSNKSGRDLSSKKRRRRVTTSSSDDEESYIDQKTEEVLRKSAHKNNLSTDEVKIILKKVCSNDHVLALVKLKEEEMERIENSPKNTAVISSEEETDERTVKLTRAKARQLNKNPLPIPPLKIQPREITSLIHDELGSDEDDDEYQPGDEEPPSDDDLNTTASDLDSQPRTPYNPNEDDNIIFTADGLFKIPRLRTESMNSAHTVEDYTIAKQTRSKVSLTETPIESIESGFQPPDDIPFSDDHAIDHNYLEFLQDIFQPTPDGNNQNASNLEEDDEDDEDFVALSKIPDNREEMYNAPIPKQEYHDLLNELFGDLPDLSAFDCLNGRSDDLTTPEPPPLEPATSHTTPAATSQELVIQTLSTQVLNQSTSVLHVPETQYVLTSPLVTPLVYQSLVTPIKTMPTIIPYYTQDPIHKSTIPTIIVTNDLPVQPPLIQAETLNGPKPIADTNHSTRYQRKLYHNLEYERPLDYAFDEKLQGFCSWQIAILQQQLQQHVQFAAQNYLQTYGHPGDNYWKYAETFGGYLTELNLMLENSRVLKVANLKDALTLVQTWQSERSIVNDTNTEFMNYMLHESEKSQFRRSLRSSYIFQFHPLVMRTVLQSSVFIYPSLLPHIPFRLDIRPKYRTIVPVEDFLIAFNLERFYIELRAKLTRYKLKDVEKQMRLETVCKMIAAEMMPLHRTNLTQKCSVYTYVVRRRNQADCFNPIQFYFKHKRAPTFRHILVDTTTTFAPIDAAVGQLPYCWENEAKRLKGLQVNAQLNPEEHQRIAALEETQKKHSSIYPSIVPRQSASLPAHDSHLIPNAPDPSQSKVIVKVVFDQLNSTAFGQAPAFDPNLSIFTQRPYDTCSEHSSDSTKTQDHSWNASIPKDQTLITRYFKNISKKEPDSIVSADSSGNPINCTSSSKSSNVISKQLLRKQARIRMVQLAKRQSLIKVLVNSFCKYLLPVRKFQQKLRKSNIFLLRILNCITSIDLYLYLLVHLRMNGTEKRPRQPESQHSSATIMADEGSAKKLPRKSPQLLVETKEEVDEKDLAFAQNYLDRVESAFAAEENTDRFTEFEELLKSFDPAVEKASDLYLKIEAFFLPDHPELAELFLSFLLPGEAAQLGKFMEHFLVTNMNNFINKLNIYFNKQPAQIRKIMTSLKDLSEEESLTVDQIKTKILPLLRGNVLLIEWFQQCFPSDRVADFTSTKFESLNFHKATETGDDLDVYEYIPQSELVPDPINSPCHIRYINGNIYYGSRILLPAQLSFQVHSTTQETNLNNNQQLRPDQREETAGGYHCVHDIKRVGDIKFREQLRIHLENECHVTSTGTPEVIEERLLAACTDKPIAFNDTAIDEPVSVTIDGVSNNCCTDIMLKAHAIRLNPNAHSTELIRSSDLMELLRPYAHGYKSSETLRGSPKKQSHQRPLAASFAVPVDPQRSSKSSADASNNPGKRSVVPPRTKTAKKCIASTIAVPMRSTEKPLLDSPDPITIKAELNVDLPDSQLWSRDEDKILLEEIKNGFESVDTLVQTLQQSNQLPNRTYDQIHDRFTFLMDIIVNL